jgi:hypothetical protein
MKSRVFYRPDGAVAIVHPAPKAKRQGETDEAFFERTCFDAAVKAGLSGLDFDDMDDSLLPPRSDRDKWRGVKGQGVRIDHTIITKAERRAALEAELDAELAKPNANEITAMRLKRKLDKGDY